MAEPSRITCSHCKGKRIYLHWEQIGGMRMIRESKSGKKYYSARCPECANYFHIPVKGVKLTYNELGELE